MHIVQLAVSFLAISQLLFTGLYFLGFHRNQPRARLCALYCLSMIAYVADNLPQLDNLPALNHTASFFAILAPGVFWMICKYYFDDEARISKWIIASIGFYTILRFVGVLAEGMDFVPSLWLQFIFFILPNIIMLTFAGHVIYMAVQGRTVDLIELRRQTRLPFAIVMALFLLIVIVSETLLLPNTHFDNALYFLIFVMALIFNLRLFRQLELEQSSPVFKQPLSPGTVQVTVNSKLPPDADKELIQQIKNLMEHERRYSTMGLTITALSVELRISEHRLRRVINYQLHYRNFNQFLNYYRISEASQRLISEEEAHLPILTIAMDVGYRSLSSFNKAFMAKHQITPSQYRQKSVSRKL